MLNVVSAESLNPWLRQCFTQLVANQTGLKIREDDQSSFSTKVLSRTKALKLSCPEAYYQLLASKTNASLQEWQNLAILLTNPESFFLRDKNQFSLLKNHILPELISRKQNTKTIRVCSAGCSTGEEPYSLAILFRELIPNIESWNLTILGVDINSVSLEKAKTGVYRSWSFRGVDAKIQKAYFKQSHDRYSLLSDVKNMTVFEILNLVKDPFPDQNSKLRDMDLILCRNVFIYFEETAIAQVLDKFYNSLQPLGYLITGHAELHHQNLGKFQPKVFPEALIYQRPEANVHFPPVLPSTSARDSASVKANVESQKIVSYRSNSIDMGSKLGNAELIKTEKHDDLTESKLIHRAENLLRQKAYHLAMYQVERAIERCPTNAHSYFLLAQIHIELCEFEKALSYCQQAINLEADQEQSIRMQELALDVLTKLPPKPISNLDNLTAAELTSGLKSTLEKS